MREHFFVGWRLFGFALHFALDLAEHDKFIRVGLLATAVDFQIAQHERAFAVSLQKNKGIGRPKSRRVKHIGIGFARRHDHPGFAISDFGFWILDFHFLLVPPHFELFSQNPMQQREQPQ